MTTSKGGLITRRHAMLTAFGVATFPRGALLAAESKRANLIIPVKLLRDRLATTIAFEKGKSELMLVDTGTIVSSIAADRAMELKLRIHHKMDLTGIGGIRSVNIVSAKNTMLGGVYEDPEMWLATSDLLNSTKYKATLGAEVLGGVHGELDFENDQWRVYFDGSIDRTGFARVENSFRFNGWAHEFQLNCAIDGQMGVYHVDTGSPTNMILDGRASAKLGKWNSGAPYAPWRIRGHGRNRLRTRLYRLEKMAVQGIELLNPLLLLSDPNVVQSNFEHVDGLIGLRALRYLHISIDPASKALWLAPNGLRFDDEFRYPMSGLWLEQEDGRIVVDEVGFGSPAAAIDIRVGDAIIGENFEALITKINDRAGTIIPIVMERKGERLSKELTLKPYL